MSVMPGIDPCPQTSAKKIYSYENSLKKDFRYYQMSANVGEVVCNAYPKGKDS